MAHPPNICARYVPLAIAGLLLGACSANRNIAPLGVGTGAITASLGGPFNADLGTAVPLPISSIGYAHGVSDKTNVYGAFYPSGALFFGVPGIDIGAGTELLAPQGARPRLMGHATLYGFAGNAAEGDPPGAARLFPDVGVTAAWPVGPHAIYGGLDLFSQLFPEQRLHTAPHIGAQVRTGRLGLQLQYAWWAPETDNFGPAPVWRGPFTQGASTLQLGMDVRLGASKPSAPTDDEVTP